MVRYSGPLCCLCGALLFQLGASAAVFNGAMLAGVGGVHRKHYSDCRMLTASATTTKKMVYESDTVVKQENPLVQGTELARAHPRVFRTSTVGAALGAYSGSLHGVVIAGASHQYNLFSTLLCIPFTNAS
jgi:hypothetical protein